MRVAILARSAHPLHAPGGLERAVFELARHLDALGVEVSLFTRPATRDGTFPGATHSVAYETIPAGPHGRILDRTLNYPLFAKRLAGAVAPLVRAGSVDIVHAHGLTALGYGCARRDDTTLRAPLVMNPHGMEEHKTRGLKRLALCRLRLLSRRAAALADRVIATDASIAREIPSLLGVSDDRVRLVPNGVDVDAIDAQTPPDAREKAEARFTELAGSEPVLLSVGRLEPYKGFTDVLGALEILHRRGALPAAWRWVVVGAGPAAAALTSTPLVEHIVFAGAVDDALLHALYERADMFVHAPHFEGSSLVTLEAMAHGKPVVGTHTGGLPDKIDDATGRLAAVGDVAGLAEAVAELCAAPERRRALGRAARARVVERFTWPRLAAQTVALYDELLSAA